MKTTIESLDFTSEIKNKLKMKVSTTNLKIEFISGHIVKFDKTNLSVQSNNIHHIQKLNQHYMFYQ